MRRMYQEEWHGIPFRSFAKLSSTRLADGAFYSEFYKRFFEKFRSPDDLDAEWLWVKRQARDFVVDRVGGRPGQRILSLGCGLGLIESQLLDAGFSNLEINEVSPEPLRWVSDRFPQDRVHTGFFPRCVPPARRYDVILMLGLEGVLEEAQLRSFLSSVHERLNDGGGLILMSWSHQAGRSRSQAVIDGAKDIVKAVLDRVGLRPRGQLWSFMRSDRELRQAVRSAGFVIGEDGMLPQETRFPTYWIVARKN